MNEYLSKKIKFISFLAIVGVVYAHAYNYEDVSLSWTTTISEGHNIFAMLQFFISNAIIRFSVPVFFAISGYLFFRNYKQSIGSYLSKVKKRTTSLLAPYLIWIALSGVLLFVVYNLSAQGVFGYVDYSVGNIKDNGIMAWLMNPPAFQLWFLLDLFKLVLLSPVIYLLIKKTKWLPLVLASIYWIFNVQQFINCDGVLFFVIGAFIAINKKEDIIMKKSKITMMITSSAWIICCLVYTYLSSSYVDFQYPLAILAVLFKVIVLLGIVSVWLMYDYYMVNWENNKFLCFIVRNVFIIYLLHEPLQHLVYEYFLNISNSNVMHTAVYIVVSFVFIVACAGVGELLKKKFPKARKILTGGR